MVNKHVMALRRQHLQYNAARIQAEHSREQNKFSLNLKKSPKRRRFAGETRIKMHYERLLSCT